MHLIRWGNLPSVNLILAHCPSREVATVDGLSFLKTTVQTAFSKNATLHQREAAPLITITLWIRMIIV